MKLCLIQLFLSPQVPECSSVSQSEKDGVVGVSPGRALGGESGPKGSLGAS